MVKFHSSLLFIIYGLQYVFWFMSQNFHNLLFHIVQTKHRSHLVSQSSILFQTVNTSGDTITSQHQTCAQLFTAIYIVVASHVAMVLFPSEVSLSDLHSFRCAFEREWYRFTLGTVILTSPVAFQNTTNCYMLGKCWG